MPVPVPVSLELGADLVGDPHPAVGDHRLEVGAGLGVGRVSVTIS